MVATLVGAVASAAVPAVAGQPARADAAASHVAVVVAYPGSPTQVACVPWHSGMTGLDALGWGFNVGYDFRSGAAFVTTINAQPSSGFHDLTHYWSYWHGGSAGWSYSGSGAGSFTPSPGSVEGWSYDNGDQNAPAPPSMSYATVCAGQDAVSSSKPAPSTRPATTTAASAPAGTNTGRAAGAPGMTDTTSSASAATSAQPSRSGSHGTGTAGDGAAGVVASHASSSAAPAPDAAAVEFVRARRKPQSSSGPPVATLIGLAVAFAVGAGALIRARGRRGSVSG